MNKNPLNLRKEFLLSYDLQEKINEIQQMIPTSEGGIIRYAINELYLKLFKEHTEK